MVHCPGIVLVHSSLSRCLVPLSGGVASSSVMASLGRGTAGFNIRGSVTAGCVYCDQTDDFRGRSRLLRVTELCRRFCERSRRVAFPFRLHGERSVTQKTSGSGSFDGAACSASCMLDSVLRRFILPLVFFSIFA